LLDLPGGHKLHSRAVPPTGGVAVAGGLAAGCLAAYAGGAFTVSSSAPGGNVAAVAATAVVLWLGLREDSRGCSVGMRLLFQCLAAILIVALPPIGGPGTLFVPVAAGDGFLLGAAGAVVAVGWLVGVTNAINFIDGLDGLAGGMGGIMACSLAVVAALQGDAASLAVALSLCGACVGFLPCNRKPAQVFLGDVGALTIGFVLASLALNLSLEAAHAAAVFVQLIVLGLPTFDALLVMLARYLEDPDRGW